MTERDRQVRAALLAILSREAWTVEGVALRALGQRLPSADSLAARQAEFIRLTEELADEGLVRVLSVRGAWHYRLAPEPSVPP